MFTIYYTMCLYLCKVSSAFGALQRTDKNLTLIAKSKSYQTFVTLQLGVLDITQTTQKERLMSFITDALE